jgi:hypothetical protein
MATKFSFVSGSSVRSKLSWSLEAQAIIVRTHKVNGVGGSKAFEVGVAEYNAGVAAGTITGPALPTFENLPASYQGKNAGSVLYGMEKRFLNRCNDGDAATITLATKYGIVAEVPATE